MEMHSGTLCATPEGALRVIEQTNSPNLKINFQVVDPSSPDLERTIAMVGRYVVNVHAQNYRRSPLDPEKIELCLLEEGMVDYDKVLSLLAEHGFNRFVEVEFLKGEHVSEEAMLDSLRKDAAYLQKLVDRHTATA
jgi:sugar phosphate isomerase/epimerase